MALDYDVVVVGGGPSGLQFAREVTNRSGYSVAVLEANAALSDNDKSTGGTFHQVIHGYDVPDDVVMDTSQNVLFEGPGASSRLPLPGYVLDFPEFLEFLGKDADRLGADIYTGARVREPLSNDGRITGVRYRSGGTERDVSAQLVVDATGPAAVLTTQLGMFDRENAQRGIGKEYEVEGRFDLDSMVFRFNHDDAPGGYAWTFPAGDGVFKAGVCWVNDFYEKHSPDDDGPIDGYIERWIEGDSRWELDRTRAVHAGKVVVNNSLNTRAVDGLMAIGDAVSSINSLFGEGIRPGMESAEMAADVAVKALDAGDTSQSRLSAYEERWNVEKGPHWKRQRVVGELLYDFDADQQDRFVRQTGTLSEDQLQRLQRYELTIRDLWHLYPFKLRDVQKAPKLLRHL